jgi:site-specific DNA recombinase
MSNDSVPNKLVVGYIRCSSVLQVRDGETLERQEAKIKEYCNLKGIVVNQIISDEGISGFKTKNRPGFQKLLDMCRSNQVSMVIVYDLSRLSRNVRDTLAFVDDIVHKRNVGLVSLLQDLDTTTPTGKAFLGFIAIFNELFRNDIGFRTKLALQHLKHKGEQYSGTVPYGFYSNDNGQLLVSESEAQLVLRIQKLRREGMSLRKIAKILEDDGLKTKNGNCKWNPTVISNLASRTVGHGT